METITPLPTPTATAGILWTIDEVAAYLRCTVRHVHNLLRAGLPHIYLGRLLRFDPEEVRGYLLKQRRIDVT
ncbi:MAG: helix-turn-helix domain-containing protein [Opitutaceae bacterium]|nr:helix-turn-helix domain-containing protein [Opitutaceae bacterium]